MVTDETIKRINELYRKSKAEGLTKEELQEQAQLRRAYIDAMKASMRSHLENITIQNPDGSLINVKERHDEKMKHKNGQLS
jgi:uncharacterized protein YnzC (UPF0291/DUF896 family)